VIFVAFVVEYLLADLARFIQRIFFQQQGFSPLAVSGQLSAWS